MDNKEEPKKGWRERHKVNWKESAERRHAELKAKQVAGPKVGEPKPETVAKVQRVLLVGGIIITVLGVLGLLILYAC